MRKKGERLIALILIAGGLAGCFGGKKDSAVYFTAALSAETNFEGFGSQFTISVENFKFESLKFSYLENPGVEIITDNTNWVDDGFSLTIDGMKKKTELSNLTLLFNSDNFADFAFTVEALDKKGNALQTMDESVYWQVDNREYFSVAVENNQAYLNDELTVDLGLYSLEYSRLSVRFEELEGLSFSGLTPHFNQEEGEFFLGISDYTGEDSQYKISFSGALENSLPVTVEAYNTLGRLVQSKTVNLEWVVDERVYFEARAEKPADYTGSPLGITINPMVPDFSRIEVTLPQEEGFEVVETGINAYRESNRIMITNGGTESNNSCVMKFVSMIPMTGLVEIQAYGANGTAVYATNVEMRWESDERVYFEARAEKPADYTGSPLGITINPLLPDFSRIEVTLPQEEGFEVVETGMNGIQQGNRIIITNNGILSSNNISMMSFIADKPLTAIVGAQAYNAQGIPVYITNIELTWMEDDKDFFTFRSSSISNMVGETFNFDVTINKPGFSLFLVDTPELSRVDVVEMDSNFLYGYSSLILTNNRIAERGQNCHFSFSAEHPLSFPLSVEAVNESGKTMQSTNIEVLWELDDWEIADTENEVVDSVYIIVGDNEAVETIDYNVKKRFSTVLATSSDTAETVNIRLYWENVESGEQTLICRGTSLYVILGRTQFTYAINSIGMPEGDYYAYVEYEVYDGLGRLLTEYEAYWDNKFSVVQFE